MPVPYRDQTCVFDEIEYVPSPNQRMKKDTEPFSYTSAPEIEVDQKVGVLYIGPKTTIPIGKNKNGHQFLIELKLLLLGHHKSRTKASRTQYLLVIYTLQEKGPIIWAYIRLKCSSCYSIRASSIVQGYAVGVRHYLLGRITTRETSFLARIIAVG